MGYEGMEKWSPGYHDIDVAFPPSPLKAKKNVTYARLSPDRSKDPTASSQLPCHGRVVMLHKIGSSVGGRCKGRIAWEGCMQ